MPKIQILNETQVNHFADVLLPELLVKFNAKADELEKLAEERKDNFATHAEIIELKKKQEERIAEVQKIIDFSKQLKEIHPKYRIYSDHYDLISTEKDLEDLIKDQKEIINLTILNLSKKALHVDNRYTRQEMLTNELTARLSMAGVGTFDEIKTNILKSIDPLSYLTNPLN